MYNGHVVGDIAFLVRVRLRHAVCHPSSDPVTGRDKMAVYPAVIGGSGNKVLVTATTAGNATLLATFCKDRVPRSCDHTLLANSSRVPRPCFLSESFLSTGDSLTLELRLAESTALRYVDTLRK
jgi:hypothetical protein